MTPRLARPIAVAVGALAVVAACHTTKAGRRYTKDEIASSLKRLEVVALAMGEFPIDGASAVVDGDTVRVKGMENTLRLLALDTEETFKTNEEKRAFAAGWDPYVKALRGNSPKPVKMATPLGEEAKKWAQDFFERSATVKLERDHPGEIRDYYGRYLGYVFVERDGVWVNYNIECVRAGYSPYFTKYGRSRRFHKEFVEAMREAREARRGIWDPQKQHYPDYDERLAWWDARAKVVQMFEDEMARNPSYVAITRWDAMLKLESRVGDPVVVLGAVRDVRLGDHGPTIVKLGRARGSDFDVVFFDKDVVLSSGILENVGEFVRIRGVVNRWRDRVRNIDRLQMVVGLPGQVLAPSPQLEKILEEDRKSGPGANVGGLPSPDDEED